MEMNVLDENDVYIYNEWANSNDNNERDFVNDWNQFDSNLGNTDDFNFDNMDFDHLATNTLSLGGDDFVQKYSPESSDSGNYSPTSSLADTFNAAETWNAPSNPIVHNEFTNQSYTQERVPLQSFNEVPKIVTTNNNYSAVTNQFEIAKRPTNECYFTASTPATCASVVFARPMETLALVPTIASNAQTFVIASTSAVKMEPILTPIKQLQPVAMTSTVNVNPHKNSATTVEDDYSKKLEDRRLRNRAAAQASRTRKRLQMDEMKEKLLEVESERDQLRLENEALRKRIEELEQEKLSYGGPSRPKKSRAVAGVCLAMCALVFTFYGSVPENYLSDSTELQFSQQGVIEKSPELMFLKRHGRSLASVSDYDGVTNDYQMPTNSSNPICPTSLNMTEKMRLNDDISSWINRHEQMNLVEIRKGLSPFLIYNSPNAVNFNRSAVQKVELLSNSTELVQITNEERRNRRIARRNSLIANRQLARENLNKKSVVEGKIKIDKRLVKDYDHRNTTALVNGSDYQLSVRSQFENDLMEQLASTIQQHNDTLYVVTMKEYFLLPTLHRNITNSPKLSIVFPALIDPTNNSNQIKMMRIDCQIVGTELLDVPQILASVLNQSTAN
ncbi:BZIP domain-containing protein [Aphelenchoides besseyi]|nr:BZIP domain-containing protein [Aphelenchoides besseyi]KAI6232541.1 BZIP domain-containing protein [Aphelenchoides besseyi]